MRNSFLADLKNAISQAVHQCNNHLSIILSNCELALAINNAEVVKKKIESNLVRVTEMTDLLAQLNRFSNINTDIKPTDLKWLLADPLNQVAARCYDNQIQCSIQSEVEGIFSLPADVIQMILELLGKNAITSAQTSADKKISFVVQHSNDKLSLTASNSGTDAGLRAEKAAFQTFYSDRNEPVYNYLGIVKSLTELLGGHITFQKNLAMNKVQLIIPLKYEDNI